LCLKTFFVPIWSSSSKKVDVTFSLGFFFSFFLQLGMNKAQGASLCCTQILFFGGKIPPLYFCEGVKMVFGFTVGFPIHRVKGLTRFGRFVAPILRGAPPLCYSFTGLSGGPPFYRFSLDYFSKRAFPFFPYCVFLFFYGGVGGTGNFLVAPGATLEGSTDVFPPPRRLAGFSVRIGCVVRSSIFLLYFKRVRLFSREFVCTFFSFVGPLPPQNHSCKKIQNVPSSPFFFFFFPVGWFRFPWVASWDIFASFFVMDGCTYEASPPVSVRGGVSFWCNFSK